MVLEVLTKAELWIRLYGFSVPLEEQIVEDM